MNAAPKILVTGATGHIGAELVGALRSSGADVVAGSRGGSPVDGAPGRCVDFGNVAAMTRAFGGVDALFLLFPLVPAKRELARSAVAAARAAGVKHLVRSSGAGADAAADGALAKLQGEIDEIVTSSGIPATIVAPSTFMQNWVDYYAGMVRAGTVYMPLGESRTAYVDVRDIAAATAAVLRDPAAHAGRTYVLTGPAPLGVAEGLAEIERATGRHASYVPVPESAAVESMRSMGMDAWSIEMLSSLNRAAVAGATAGVTDHVQRLTGRAPRSFADFVHDHADAWR